MDIGRSGIKAVAEHKQRLFGLPTIAKLPINQEWQGLSDLNRIERKDGLLHLDSWRLGYEGEEWLIGERAERLGLSACHEMTVAKATPATRLLVLAAVSALGAPPFTELCVGVPLHNHEEQGQLLQRLLKGEHRVNSGGREQHLMLKGVVVPEGLGLWLRAATPDGVTLDQSLMQVPTAVVDLGHRTIQLAVWSGLRIYPQSFVSAHGVYEVWEAALKEAFEGPGQTVYESPQRAMFMTRLIRDGELSLRGRTVTLEALKPMLALHVKAAWGRIRRELDKALEQVPYERVVVGGGGATLFADVLMEYFGESKVVIMEDRFAQAEGYRLFLEHRDMLRELA
jgi:hypothetical protein